MIRKSPAGADAALAERVAGGDMEAFRTLFQRYARLVYALAVHTLGTADAEEVVQDVFVRLWRKAAQFDPERGSFITWLTAIAHHRVLDELRRRGNGWTAAESIDALLAETEDRGSDPEEKAWLNSRSEFVLAALRTLPVDQRRVLVLAYFGGLSHASIAVALGWPLGTVKKRIRLGLQKLRAALEGEVEQTAGEARTEAR